MNALPVEDILPHLKATLSTRDEVVLQAPPGAGKTTVVPLALLSEPWLDGQKILLLEPRRIAARTAAQRMASQLSEAVGQTVGYRIRLDTCVSPATRIEVITEGVLTQMLQRDPGLEGIGLLIFDEFHERHLDADLGLALALQGRALLRDESPLKILVMSATLDGEGIAQLLNNAPLISSEGQSYPVSVRYSAPWQPGEWIEPKVVNAIIHALAEESGSLLVFLPGQAEIRRVAEQLNAALPSALAASLQVAPLFGELSLQQQQQAIAPAPDGWRKVVLTTAIAETSLTIEGIRVVIDSGLSRQAVYDPNTGMTRLVTRRVSRASATQRTGRAGRLSAGVCYRLWSEDQHAQLAPFNTPEIQQADLTPLALQLLRWGCQSPDELSWLDQPASSAIAQARDLLQQLGAAEPIDAGLRLTPHGEAMANLPLHPRLAHMLLTANQFGLTERACQLAALFQERDPLNTRHADLHTRIDWLTRPLNGAEKARQQRIMQQYRAFMRLMPTSPATVQESIAEDDQNGFLLACAWPDRIAQQKGGHLRYLLSSGRAALLNEGDYLSQSRWLAIAQLGGYEHQSHDKIWLAAPLNPALFEGPLQTLTRKDTCVEWRQNQLIAEQQVRCGALVISSKPLPELDQETKIQALLQLIRQQGLTLLTWPENLLRWRERVQFLHQTEPRQNGTAQWPDLSDSTLLASLEHWLAPFLIGISSKQGLKQLDLTTALHSILPWSLSQQLEQRAPQHLQVPSGAHIAIDYSSTPPILAVKLQAMFGCVTTPEIGYGTALKIHLLSPAGRPLQVTQNLESFWRDVYPEVKKEMKGRYPKHPWPDDPLTAEATGKTKRQLR